MNGTVIVVWLLIQAPVLWRDSPRFSATPPATLAQLPTEKDCLALAKKLTSTLPISLWRLGCFETKIVK